MISWNLTLFIWDVITKDGNVIQHRFNIASTVVRNCAKT